MATFARSNLQFQSGVEKLCFVVADGVMEFGPRGTTIIQMQRSLTGLKDCLINNDLVYDSGVLFL